MEDLGELRKKLEDINAIREQLIRLELNIEQKTYYDVEVRPFLDMLYLLCQSSFYISSSAGIISNSSEGKTSKAKDALKVSYDINEECKDVFKVLECKINNMIKLGCKGK